MSKGMLIDITMCVGCESCVYACREQNKLEKGDTGVLSAYNWTIVQQYGDEIYVRKMCMHCLHPACVSACPVGALEKTKEGPVIYHPGKCMGCRYCMIACPFKIPKYEWDNVNPKIQKCIMCFERIREGKEPACASECPTGATLFGEREELVKVALERIKKEPDKYVNHVYGLKEFGGTSILFLAPVPFEKLGFPKGIENTPLSEFTWKALSLTPQIAIGGAVFLYGLWWIINRRIEVSKSKNIEKEQK
ncbi:MAG: 4Fe-4S dicluster domain-containing protein [candidate division WOR-3 bacterium]